MTLGFERPRSELLPRDAERVARILESCPVLEIEAGEPYFRQSFEMASLLLVEEGFVVLRAHWPGRSRSVITCEAGPGRLLLPPSPEEVLFGLGSSRLVVITGAALERLLAVPTVAHVLLEALAATVGEKQEAIGNFASARHVDRVRRKLLQLARDYGRVARDGVRIDFPVSHTTLAEMIGSSRETVTRALDELQRTGFVERSGHRYRLLVAPEAVLGTAPHPQEM
jgi:CRP/FNR family transcriptional regulator, cyclic AMP receptor protein